LGTVASDVNLHAAPISALPPYGPDPILRSKVKVEVAAVEVVVTVRSGDKRSRAVEVLSFLLDGGAGAGTRSKRYETVASRSFGASAGAKSWVRMT
jgi:hypothetical protein